MAARSGSNLKLPKLRQESLADRAYQELKRIILSGRLTPGTHLAEVELAEALSISRTPVREALALLRRDGLVESLPSGGNVVRVLPPEEVRELFLLREALERLAIREFIRLKGDPDDLEKLLDRQERALDKTDVEQFLDADEEFHLSICRQANLPQAAQLLASLREKMRQAGLRAVLQEGRMRTVIGEHRAILDALRARRSEGALKALAEHLTATRKAFKSQMGTEELEPVSSS